MRLIMDLPALFGETGWRPNGGVHDALELKGQFPRQDNSRVPAANSGISSKKGAPNDDPLGPRGKDTEARTSDRHDSKESGKEWRMLGKWIDGGKNAMIPDFVDGEDCLLVVVDPAELPHAVLTVGVSQETGAAQILLNGQIIATLPVGVHVTADMIHLCANSTA